MRRLFLVSGVVLLTCPAFADVTINAGATTASCTESVLGTYTGPASFDSVWRPAISGAISLDSNRYTSDSSSSAQTASTAAAPTPVYSIYGRGLYTTQATAATIDNDEFSQSVRLTALTRAPVMTGYNFTGFWTTKYSEGNNATQITSGSNFIYDAASTQVLSDGGTAVWYAHWTPKTYTVTYDKGSCASTTGTAYTHTNGATYNANYTVPSAANSAITAKTGYTLAGWNTVTGQTSSNFPDEAATPWTRTADLTVYAACTPNCNAITLNNSSNGGSGGTTTLYKKSDSTAWYSNATCSTAVTSLPSAPTKTGYTYSGHYNATNGNTNYITSAGVLSTTWTVTGPTTIYAKYTPNTNTPYTVCHYLKDLGASTYTLHKGSCEMKSGTSDSTLTLANLTTPITGFTYDEGFAGTSASGTTKPSSGAVTTTILLANGTRYVNLYYTRNSYTITAGAGNGVSTVAGTGWTNTGTATMTKSYEYGSTITLSSTITPTLKTGYTGSAYTNSGSGSINSGVYTVGAGAGRITVAATGISAPTASITGGTTKIYNLSSTTLTGSNSTSYDSGITVYYNFGESDSSDGTYTYGTASTTSTKTIAKDAYRGTKYYKVKIYATDGTLTSNTTEASSPTTMSLVNKEVRFDVSQNAGTLSGSTTVFVWYGNAGVVTTSTGTTAGSVPTATKTGYTFKGWYTAASGGSQVYNASGVLQKNVSGYTSNDTTPTWVITENKTLYAQFSPICNTITLNNTTNGGTGGTTKLYKLSGSTAWYSDSGCSTAVTSLPTAPTKNGYGYAGHYNSANGTTNYITSGRVLSTTWTVTGSTTIYAKYSPNTITLTWSPNGGTAQDGSTYAAGSASGSCVYDGDIVLPALPKKDGYHMIGWDVVP